MLRRVKGLSTPSWRPPPATARSSASMKPCRSPLPQTMSAPSSRARPGSTCDQQPQTARTAPGWSSASRRRAWRDLRPLSAVTAQELTMTASALSPAAARSCPRSASSVSIACVSY